MTTIPTRILKVTILAIALLAFANNALADQIQISRFNGYYLADGGEFTLKGFDADAINAIKDIAYPAYANGIGVEGVGGDWSIQSFCLETDENISQGEVVNYVVNTNADGGGADNTGPDPVSEGTGYLYSEFATGGLAGLGYNYTPGAGRATTARALQLAIWFLENELTVADENSYVAGNMFLSAIIGGTNMFTDIAAARANNVSYDVFALNNTNQAGKRQDMLVYTSLERREVPDGGLTLMMLGMGLSGLAVLRRKLI